MKTTLLTFFVLCGLASLSATQPPAPFVLDLTRPDVIWSAPSATEGHGRAISGQPIPEIPFALTLLATDQRSYRADDRIVYSVEIRNTGTAPIGVPVSVDRAQFEPLTELPSRIVLSLRLANPGGEVESFATVLLEGSNKVPGTIHTLAPGQSLIVKTPRTLSLSPRSAAALSAAGVLELRAYMTFQDSPDLRKPLLSSNSLPISVIAP